MPIIFILAYFAIGALVIHLFSGPLTWSVADMAMIVVWPLIALTWGIIWFAIIVFIIIVIAIVIASGEEIYRQVRRRIRG